MKTEIVILGGPGIGTIIAQAIADLAALGESIMVVGFLNDRFAAGAAFAGGRVLGRFSEWKTCGASASFISAIPKPKEAISRHRLIRSLGIPEERWATIRHPAAHIARDVQIGAGTYIGPGVVIEPGARIGSHCCLRGGSYVSHDTSVGDFSFIGPNATLLGNIRLGDGVHIGANAACREEISIGEYAVVGLAAAIVENVPARTIVAGNPARVLGQVEAKSPAK